MREQELKSQYNLAFNLYNSLSQRLDQAKLDLQEKALVLSVLQPGSVPLKKSLSDVGFVSVLYYRLGFISSSGFIFLKNIYYQVNK